MGCRWRGVREELASALVSVAIKLATLTSGSFVSVWMNSPNMKNTKKQRSNTLPSIGSVSSSRVTRIRMPRAGALAWLVFVSMFAPLTVIVIV